MTADLRGDIGSKSAISEETHLASGWVLQVEEKVREAWDSPVAGTTHSVYPYTPVTLTHTHTHT